MKKDVSHLSDRVKAFTDIRTWLIAVGAITGAITGIIATFRGCS